VIVAGYQREMATFMNSNPGLSSRFTNTIHFPDYTPEECAELFTNMVAEQKLALTPDAAPRLPALFSKLRDAPHWSNGRDVRTFFGEFTLIAQANRLTATGEKDEYSITSQDLELALEAFLENKAHGAGDTQDR